MLAVVIPLVVSDWRPGLRGERPVVPGRDARRGRQPTQVPQADDAHGPRRGEGATLLHRLRR